MKTTEDIKRETVPLDITHQQKRISTDSNTAKDLLEKIKASIPKTLDFTYQVEKKKWKQFLSVKAKANALKNKVETMKGEFGFLQKEDFVKSFELTPGDKTSVPVISGDEEIGKVTYYWQEEKQIPAGWAMRIS